MFWTNHYREVYLRHCCAIEVLIVTITFHSKSRGLVVFGFCFVLFLFLNLGADCSDLKYHSGH